MWISGVSDFMLTEAIELSIIPSINKSTVDVNASKILSNFFVVDRPLVWIWQKAGECWLPGNRIAVLGIWINRFQNRFLVSMCRDSHEEAAVVHSTFSFVQFFLSGESAVVSDGHLAAAILLFIKFLRDSISLLGIFH